LDNITVQIDSIIAGGDGLARQPDGPVVFVPRTAPGDRVEVEIVEQHKQWARGRALRITEPGPARRDAPCPVYEACGGCQLQHLDYEAQLKAKSDIISDALRRLGGIEIESPVVTASPRQLGYRNRITFTLRRHPDGVVAGFHGLADPDRIVAVDRCPLAEDTLNELWESLRANWAPNADNLPPGNELRLTLRASSTGELGLAVEGGEDYGDPETLLETVPGLRSLWSVDEDGAIDWYAGEAWLKERWGEQTFGVAGLSFVQVNREAAESLESYVMEQCGDVSGRRVIDGYCGFGLRSMRLAWAGARVVGIDADEDAIDAAGAAAAESGAAARFVAAPLEEALRTELPADLVLLNPPRRGVDRQVVEALLKKPPESVVYISCDPATLARDLKMLSASFKLTACRGFDLFPQTAHVETVVSLARK
jgi:23S rRNA (uracil1939-C5)-methyltransferase